jgi:NAD(P)-dependent dehydrogenase (short-subunit alcohol dehydrogenase family)
VSNKPLTGLVALVTGGGSGIGAAIAHALAGAGARLVLSGRRLEKLKEVAQGLPGGAMCIACDVQKETEVVHTIQKTVAEAGRLDILVNNAGVFDMKPLEETSAEFWDNVIGTNLRGSFLMARHAWKHLKAAKGQIVNLSSIAGTRGFANGGAYCASKFGMNGLSEVLKIEGKPHGIRVFSVCPGSVETPLWEPLSSEDERERMMKPETIADLVAWLVCSPRGVDVEPVVVNNFKSPFEG